MVTQQRLRATSFLQQAKETRAASASRLSTTAGAGTIRGVNVKPTPQQVAYVVAVAGVLAGAAGGYVRVTTPEAAQCAVDLADKTARLELTAEAMGACERALDLCAGGTKP